MLTVIGCSNLEPPVDGYIERQGDRAVISCESKNVRWELICTDGQWLGDFGKCLKGKQKSCYPMNILGM